MANLKHLSSLTTSRILAHKRSGNVLAYLTQVGEAFFLTFGEVVNGRSGIEFKLIAEKNLTAEQAHDVLINIFNVSGTNTTAKTSAAPISDEPILLEVTKVLNTYEEPADVYSIESPYFSTKEIFLSTQMTGAPNSLK